MTCDTTWKPTYLSYYELVKKRDDFNVHMSPLGGDETDKQKKNTFPVALTVHVEAEENLHIFQFIS